MAATTASESEAAAAAAAAAAAPDDSLVAGLRQLQMVAVAGSGRAGGPAKAVRFCEWVQQLEFGGGGCGSEDDDSSSVESFTEEQLLEAQGGGDFTSLQAPPDAASYHTLMHSSSSTSSSDSLQQDTQISNAAAAAAPNSSSSSSDAALGPVLLHAELPRARGSFGRGSVESFTVLSEAGDLGEVAALLLWQEPDGSSIGGGWCLEKVTVEAALKGVSYSFSNSVINNGWVGRGRGRAVLLSKPKISKRGDGEAVQVEADELQRQLEGNAGLSGEDRQLLQRRLAQLQARLAAAG
ncbi:hypothetical protein OEZ85_000255 [Tetradesmus obliquus]|uniref:PLAT domain-containing protein n=1 Tax=Tetradesmus obliquus TaxID=3088 RepID=A0ABY8UPP3_TETOB|nr:hypothetical protein OEZ85_000255 [Tetradesmus obliquus]